LIDSPVNFSSLNEMFLIDEFNDETGNEAELCNDGTAGGWISDDAVMVALGKVANGFVLANILNLSEED
jgi:hypothetical protein